LAGLLYLGAALAVAPFAFRHRWRREAHRPRSLGCLAGAVLFGGVLGPVLMLWGLSRAPAASVALWLNLEMAATALLSWAVFKEHLGARAWMAAGLVCVASIVLAAPSDFDTGLAALLVAMACLCWGLDNNLTALIDGFTPAQATLVKGLVAGTVNIALGAWLEAASATAWLAAGALTVGGLSYGLSIVLYIAGAQQLGATRSQIIFSTAPFWGVAVSWTLLGEPVGDIQVLAGALMLVALWMMRTERHGHEHAHEPVRHIHAHRHDDGHHDHVHPDHPAWVRHTHEHDHMDTIHRHPHQPDLHHRHPH